MDHEQHEGVPQPKTFMYMPFPYTQRIKSPLPCDGQLIVFELSGTMFSSWATSFSQCVQIKDHMTILSLFVTLIQHCIDIGASFVLETVVDKVDFWKINEGKLSHCVQPRSYRLWIPLSPHASLSFCQDFASKYYDFEIGEEDAASQPKKRAKTKKDAKTTGGYCKIKTKQQLMAALRLYFGARKKINNVVFTNADESDDMHTEVDNDSNHILNLLSADTYFTDTHVAKKHAQQRLHTCQSDLSRYLYSKKLEENGIESILSFMPDAKVQQGSLCRLITTGPGSILTTANDIFKFLLPHFIPPRRLVINKIYSVLDSIGETLDEKYHTMSLENLIEITSNNMGEENSLKLFSDPINYSPIEVYNNDNVLNTNSSSFQSVADHQLEQVYPICSHLKHKNTQRLKGAARISLHEVKRVYANIVHEINTLLSAKVDGVPCIYSELLRDTSYIINSFTDMSAVASTDQILLLTRKMFYQKTPEKPKNGYTGLGTRLLRMILGSSNCLRLMEQQSSLLLLLYCRHFTTTSNQTGIGGGFFIICGPPDTGKSRACEQWLECCSRALRIENDGSSSKSYTANDTTQDLRCVYQDEIKELLVSGDTTSDASSSSGIKARQTLLSRGFVRYRRLVQNPQNGKYENEDILVVSRVMLVGNTNALNAIPPAIQSRASIVPVVKDFYRKDTKLSVNTLVASRDNAGVQLWERSFMNCMQLISGLQGRFWQLEAFGGIPGGINDNLFVLFQLLFEQDHGIDVLPPRRCLDIKETAQGIMVLDLVTLWYSRGLGARFGYCQVTESMFYATRAMLRMEHITAATWMLTSSTSLQGHTITVAQVIKSLIKMDGDYPVSTADGDYFVLSSSKRTLYNDIAHQLTHLGAGLVKQVLVHIQRGITNGIPNIKSETSQIGQEQLLVNAKFMATILMPIEKIILDILAERIKDNEDVFLSYDEQFYVFSSSVRKCIYNYNDSNTLHPKLHNHAISQVQKAIVMLSRRDIIVDKNPTPKDTFDLNAPFQTDAASSETVKLNMWYTPQQMDIAKYVESGTPGCEPCLSKASTFKVKGNKIAPLVVHKQLIADRCPKTTYSYDTTFLKSLLVAGGYKTDSRVLVGPAPISDIHSVDHYITIPPPPHNNVSVSVKNPFYAATGGIGLNLLFDEPDPTLDPTNISNENIIPDDPMFPRHKEFVTLDNNSNLEDSLIKHRYKELYNEECPDYFLPSHTNYL